MISYNLKCTALPFMPTWRSLDVLKAKVRYRMDTDIGYDRIWWDKGFSCAGLSGRNPADKFRSQPTERRCSGWQWHKPKMHGGARVSISCHLLWRSLERMSHWVGTLRDACAPLCVPLPLSYPFVVFELDFRANMRLDFWRHWLFLLGEGIPTRCRWGRVKRPRGPSPLWLGMKGQMMPVLMCEVTHACIFISI